MASQADINSLSIGKDARAMIARAREEGIETVWDRLAAQQPQCGYCAMGVSCRNCAMGPCRVDPFGEGPQKGVCGADADIIVARNLGRTIAAGASAHSDHGRDILEVFAELAEGKTSREISKYLGIGLKTAMTHRANVMAKLNVHSRVDVTKYAIRKGIIQMDDQ